MTETTQPASSSWLPSVGDLLFLLVLYLILVCLPNFIFGDGSTGWHLVTGHYILQNGHVPATDLISYTFPNKPWVAYEWLFDVFIAALDQIGGLRLVAVACCSAIAGIILLVYQDCRRGGCHYGLTLFLCVLGTFVSAIHWLARPHLVTLFCVYIYARVLWRFFNAEISAKRLWLWLGLTMLVWVNSHPAFLMGFAILFIYWFCDLFVWCGLADGELKTRVGNRLKAITIGGAIAAVASLINPYGFKLHEYILHYLNQTGVISQTDEFASPTFHGQLQPTCLELLFFFLATGLVMTKVKPALPRLMTSLAFAHLTLASLRNMPLFVVVGLPFIGELWGQARVSDLLGTTGIEGNKIVNFIMKSFRANAETVNEIETICNRHVLPILVVAVLALSCFQNGKLFGVELVRSRFSPKDKPTEVTLDAIKKYGLDPNRGFNLDNWGGFIRYKAGYRVFIDDRVDFYGQDFYFDYGDMARVTPNWKTLMDKYKIQWVLFPRNGIIITRLKTEPGWKLLAQDECSVLYVRTDFLPAGSPAIAAPNLVPYVPPPESGAPGASTSPPSGAVPGTAPTSGGAAPAGATTAISGTAPGSPPASGATPRAATTAPGAASGTTSPSANAPATPPSGTTAAPGASSTP